MNKSVLEDIEKIVEEVFEYRNDNNIFSTKNVVIHDKRLPYWTFIMLSKIFEYFIKNGVIVSFDDMINLDTMSAGFIDYDRQIAYNSIRLFEMSSKK